MRLLISLCGNKAKAIRFSSLDVIGDALGCQPGDTLGYEK
jgi:DNA-binding Xre family transcriptional regulator